MFHHRQNNLFTGVLEPPGSSFTWKRSFKFSFTTIVIQLRYSRFCCNRQNLLSPHLCFLASLNVISPVLRKADLKMKNTAKCHWMQNNTPSKLVLVQNMTQFSLFSEDMYILYYLFYSCGIDYIVPRIPLVKNCGPVQSIFGI